MTKTVTVLAQQRWEYLALTRKTEGYLLSEINLLGREGWELVSVLYYKDLKGVMCWTGFLKRPGSGQAPAPAEHGQKAAAPAPQGSVEGTPAQAGFDLGEGDFNFAE
jgi:hypothetical protein